MSLKANNISIFGTSSDAGKSTVALILAKALQNLGYSVAPFKAQNVSNNASVADDGSEIAIAQHFQATALGIATSYHLNPVLLKSGSRNSASLIVKGKAVGSKEVVQYYRELEGLKPIVNEAFEYLDARYDCVVAEGAGSPVELNLMDKDLSNIHIATTYDTKIILVADIERGGVFASIWGVYNLLPPKLRKNVIGVIVNKFRGDIKLFDAGVDIIQNRFHIPVLGVLEYKALNLGFEDSASLQNFVQNAKDAKHKVAVIAYPTMSNYNDFEPLIVDDATFVEFISSDKDLSGYDQIILPGSKLVIQDLRWLKRSGLFDRIKSSHVQILGICGGYEMLFEQIVDTAGVENSPGTKESGFGFIDDRVIMQKQKIVKRGEYMLFGKKFSGFEIHHAVSKKYPLYYERGRIKGTFVHGIFHDSVFMQKQKQIIHSYVSLMVEKLDMQRVIDAL
ncbi:MAG: cobyric acid synthase [Campylobacterota bacterium]